MTNHSPTPPAQYDPNQLLDALLKRLNLKNDAALSRALGVARPVIASIRPRATARGNQSPAATRERYLNCMPEKEKTAAGITGRVRIGG